MRVMFIRGRFGGHSLHGATNIPQNSDTRADTLSKAIRFILPSGSPTFPGLLQRLKRISVSRKDGWQKKRTPKPILQPGLIVRFGATRQLLPLILRSNATPDEQVYEQRGSLCGEHMNIIQLAVRVPRVAAEQ